MKETVLAEGIGRVDVTFSERGAGQRVLLLHGGGGPASVTAWAELLAAKTGPRVVTPTHPGLVGTPRPDALTGVGGLARVYAAFIDKLGLDGASVMGHSIGGWIAAELGLLAGASIGSLVLVDAVGIEVPGHPAEDVFGGTPATPNARVLKMYAGTMMDPSLRPRLSASAVPPTLVVWGDDDGVVDREYGRAYARAISGAEFRLLRGVGHSPQLDAPEALAETVWPFVAKHARPLRRVAGPKRVGRPRDAETAAVTYNVFIGWYFAFWESHRARRAAYGARAIGSRPMARRPRFRSRAG